MVKEHRRKLQILLSRTVTGVEYRKKAYSPWPLMVQSTVLQLLCESSVIGDAVSSMA